MQQLFYNLISNAIKFRKKGVAPVVTISCRKTDGSKIDGQETENNYYQISVTDNGIGFDEKYADDIFIVFKRLHSYHEFEGTGVGLSICKKIIEKHKGFITAKSSLDKGSTFIFGLPEKQMEMAEAK
jgi:light-regulated signal transduction histidine kinase (bacteriophytochrome)